MEASNNGGQVIQGHNNSWQVTEVSANADSVRVCDLEASVRPVRAPGDCWPSPELHSAGLLVTETNRTDHIAPRSD